MRISESCAKCLYDKQANKTDNAEYLEEVKSILEKRGEEDTSPYMVYLFSKAHEKFFGKGADYRDIKKKYNVWIARYGEYKPDVHLVYWQLSPDGRVNGIHGDVDINVFNGYMPAFRNFLNFNLVP